MSIDAPRDLDFTITMRALLSKEAPTQSVWLAANSCQVGRLHYDLSSGITRSLTGRIPRHCLDSDQNIEFKIRTDRAESPSDIGIHVHSASASNRWCFTSLRGRSYPVRDDPGSYSPTSGDMSCARNKGGTRVSAMPPFEAPDPDS